MFNLPVTLLVVGVALTAAWIGVLGWATWRTLVFLSDWLGVAGALFA